MREIKFRAWDKTTKVMYFISQIYFAVTGKLWVYDQEGNEQKDEFEVMQYIGLKDKNGTDIYEGDILKWSSHNEKGYSIMTVEFRTDLQRYNPHINFSSEIIGNIYKNPELKESL